MAKKITYRIDVSCLDSVPESEIEKVLNLAINQVRRAPNSPIIAIGLFGEANVGLVYWTDVEIKRNLL